MTTAEHVRVVVVGSGFAGIAASVALVEAGIDHVVLERADDIGGTWRDNVYPGCRCDVPSHLYSFSFAPNPDWRHTFSYQEDIQAYLRRVAEEHGVLVRTRLGHDVVTASWDGDARRWRLSTTGGELSADVVILGNGPLAEPSLPDLPGLDGFAGTIFHSARWDHDHDLDGARVAVVGTGASAVQFVPRIQRQVGHLTVFQRTAPWVLPRRNRRISALERSLYRRVPLAQRLARQVVYWNREAIAVPLLHNGRAVKVLEWAGRRHLARQVADPDLRARLTPDYRPGCKRLLFSNGWYPTLGRENVELVTEKISRIQPHGIETTDGRLHEVDTIIFGTGFHVTDNPIAGRLRGRLGRILAERYEDGGMQAFLGTTVPEFPNLFLLAGPNTTIGHTSLIVMIEAQVRYIVDGLRVMARRGATVAELREPVLQRWSEEIARKAAPTVWNAGGCSSWYLDAHGRNTTMWPDHTFRFMRRARRFDPDDYLLSSDDSMAE